MKKPLLLLLSLIVVSCVEDNLPIQGSDMDTSEPENEFPVFEELPNPHSTDVAQAVLDSLGINDIEIKPNHKYVRIKVMPGDTLQMSLLEDDLGLALFDCPLDVDIPDGEEYIDETFIDGEPTWYYTVVGYDYQFPEDTICEVLIDNAYIPEPDMMVRDLDGNMVEFEGLMYERMGYVSPLQTRGGGGQKPSGRVVMEDPDLGEEIDIKQIRVKIYNFLHIDDVWTDENGKFTADEKFYANTVRYTVVYLNKDDNFVVRCTGGSHAKYQTGKHGYDYTIRITEDSTGDAWRWTAIYNSAWVEADKISNANVAVLMSCRARDAQGNGSKWSNRMGLPFISK